MSHIHLSDVDERDIIRAWVGRGEHQGKLGDWTSITGALGSAYWIGSATLVGSVHPDNSRMAICIDNYRKQDTGGYGAIVRAFDALVAEHFPNRQAVATADAAPAEPPAAPLKRRSLNGSTPAPEFSLFADAGKISREMKAAAPEPEPPKLRRRGILPPDERGTS